MPIYNVTLKRKRWIYEYAEVTVEADDGEEAVECVEYVMEDDDAEPLVFTPLYGDFVEDPFIESVEPIADEADDEIIETE